MTVGVGERGLSAQLLAARLSHRTQSVGILEGHKAVGMVSANPPVTSTT